ncbi:MAG: winged helix-turn-helix transcriptional regulator [Anaerolineales bacterium]|nr:winged helix-turn-helix transcriptional regulator [Anaerolineales bacterium]
MNAYQTQSQFYKILMHPTRLAILDVLRDGEQCVCHMEAVLGLRQAHISQHLMVLREAGLVTDRRDGWNIFYRVCKPEIYTVMDAMDAFSGAVSRSIRVALKKKACPCPKCNPEAAPIRCSPADQGLEMIKVSDR